MTVHCYHSLVSSFHQAVKFVVRYSENEIDFVNMTIRSKMTWSYLWLSILDHDYNNKRLVNRTRDMQQFLAPLIQAANLGIAFDHLGESYALILTSPLLAVAVSNEPLFYPLC